MFKEVTYCPSAHYAPKTPFDHIRLNYGCITFAPSHLNCAARRPISQTHPQNPFHVRPPTRRLFHHNLIPGATADAATGRIHMSRQHRDDDEGRRRRWCSMIPSRRGIQLVRRKQDFN